MSAIIQKNGLPSFSEEALIKQLKGIHSSEKGIHPSELDTFILRNIFKLSQINDCAKKALESLPKGSTNYTSDGLFTNINDQLEQLDMINDQLETETQRDTIKSELEKCILAEESLLNERHGLIFGFIASIFSRLFGTIGETHKILASIATVPTFATSTLSLDGLNGLVPAQKLEFESSDVDQTLEYKDL